MCWTCLAIFVFDVFEICGFLSDTIGLVRCKRMIHVCKYSIKYKSCKVAFFQTCMVLIFCQILTRLSMCQMLTHCCKHWQILMNLIVCLRICTQLTIVFSFDKLVKSFYKLFVLPISRVWQICQKLRSLQHSHRFIRIWQVFQIVPNVSRFDTLFKHWQICQHLTHLFEFDKFANVW